MVPGEGHSRLGEQLALPGVVEKETETLGDDGSIDRRQLRHGSFAVFLGRGQIGDDRHTGGQGLEDRR